MRRPLYGQQTCSMYLYILLGNAQSAICGWSTLPVRLVPALLYDSRGIWAKTKSIDNQSLSKYSFQIVFIIVIIIINIFFLFVFSTPTNIFLHEPCAYRKKKNSDRWYARQNSACVQWNIPVVCHGRHCAFNKKRLLVGKFCIFDYVFLMRFQGGQRHP